LSNNQYNSGKWIILDVKIPENPIDMIIGQDNAKQKAIFCARLDEIIVESIVVLHIMRLDDVYYWHNGTEVDVILLKIINR